MGQTKRVMGEDGYHNPSNATMRSNASGNIEWLIEKRDRRQWLLDQTLKLIEKAEEKRRFDKERRRKWDRILTRLEDSWIEVKRSVAECDTLIDIERAKARRSAEAPLETPAGAQVDMETHAADVDPGKRAAYKIVATPVECLPAISIQDTAFAQAYTERRTFSDHDSEFKRTLTAKLELASQLPHTADDSPASGDRRNQRMLREAVGKAQRGSVEQMTDDEIDLVVSCYTILSNKLVPSTDNKRLMDIISRVIETLQAERERRHLALR